MEVAQNASVRHSAFLDFCLPPSPKRPLPPPRKRPCYGWSIPIPFSISTAFNCVCCVGFPNAVAIFNHRCLWARTASPKPRTNAPRPSSDATGGPWLRSVFSLPSERARSRPRIARHSSGMRRSSRPEPSCWPAHATPSQCHRGTPGTPPRSARWLP